MESLAAVTKTLKNEQSLLVGLVMQDSPQVVAAYIFNELRDEGIIFFCFGTWC